MIYWEESYTTSLIAQQKLNTLKELLELQIKFATSLPHGAEAALRFWATVNKTVANSFSHVDVERFVGLSNALTSMGIPRRKADSYSKLAPKRWWLFRLLKSLSIFWC